MADSLPLNQSEEVLELGATGIEMQAPGLQGQVVWHGRREPVAVRAESQESQQLRDAIQEAGLSDLATIELNAETPPLPPGYQRILLDEVAPNEVLFDVPVTSLDEQQFAIYIDEDGAVSLEFPQESAAAPAGTRSARGLSRRYRIPLRQAAGRPQSENRLMGALALKIIKFVARKALGAAAGVAIKSAAQLWENKCRGAQGFHGGSVDQLLAAIPIPVTDWKALQKQKALLFIHGTTSTTAGAFQGLKQFSAVSQELYQRYGNRVLGFNHHTLTKCVAQNVIDFHDALPEGEYYFDIVCHSRGGLVARSLLALSHQQLCALSNVTWSSPANKKVKIEKIFMVGTPNAATDLADPNDVPRLLNRLATVISLIDIAGPILALGAVLSAASDVVEKLQHLPGLCDMSPNSPLLAALNVKSNFANDYWAVQANFRPSGSLAAVLEKGAQALVFKDKENDLIVPTAGVSVTPAFDLAQVNPVRFFQFNGDDVNHVNYFYQQEVWDKALAFLP